MSACPPPAHCGGTVTRSLIGARISRAAAPRADRLWMRCVENSPSHLLAIAHGWTWWARTQFDGPAAVQSAILLARPIANRGSTAASIVGISRHHGQRKAAREKRRDTLMTTAASELTRSGVSARRTTAHDHKQLARVLGWTVVQVDKAAVLGVLPPHDLKTPRWKAATVDDLGARREELAAALDEGALRSPRTR